LFTLASLSLSRTQLRIVTYEILYNAVGEVRYVWYKGIECQGPRCACLFHWSLSEPSLQQQRFLYTR